jgi:hypothetical protein
MGLSKQGVCPYRHLYSALGGGLLWHIDSQSMHAMAFVGCVLLQVHIFGEQ